MSWAPEVKVDGKWAGNAVRFATKEEAEESGRELLSRWWVPTDSRAVPSDDPVNYRWVDGRPERID
jgi:murein tripeptide amidase MpaA